MNPSGASKNTLISSETPAPSLLLAPRIAAESALQLAPIPNWSVRIKALDGLRGIAILLVLLCHAVFCFASNSKVWARFLAAGQFTWIGVDLFFVMSGFLIVGQGEQQVLQGGVLMPALVGVSHCAVESLFEIARE